MNIAVLGAGSWGTALALALARNQHQVMLWAHRTEHAAALKEHRCNQRYLADFPFPSNLRVETDLMRIVQRNQCFLLATPSHAFRAVTLALHDHGLVQDHLFIWASKGFDPDGPTMLSQVADDILGPDVRKAMISGPSFSKEVAADLPTAITAASTDDHTAFEVANLFHGGRMRVYPNTDLIGVQIGGAIKNVMAIAAGISDGLGFGANSRAAIITRGLAEISRLGIAAGAHPATFQGLAGLGDLVLTCTDNQSRNRRLGLGIGAGETPAVVLSDIGQEVEGFGTAREVVKLAEQYAVEMPICQQVYKVLYQGLSPQIAVESLLARELVVE